MTERRPGLEGLLWSVVEGASTGQLELFDISHPFWLKGFIRGGDESLWKRFIRVVSDEK
jgi:hypothetical protein